MTDGLIVSYSGGIADKGQLHFYEYGRAQYALSRIIATVEHYRRTGRIPQRITNKTYVETIVLTPRKGSFATELLLPAAREAAATALSVPLSGFLSYILEIASPKLGSTEETTLQLANIRLAEEKEKTRQSREETKRIKALESIVETQNITTRQSLELVDWALKSSNTALGRAGFDQETLDVIRSDLTASFGRSEETRKFETQLSQVDPHDAARLASRITPMLQEAALPLRRSANFVGITENKNDRLIGFFDEERANALEEREVLNEPIRVTCKIKAYDRETGVGKVRSANFLRVLNFLVPPKQRNYLQAKILAAMSRDDVLAEFIQIVDRNGVVTSLQLIDLELNEITEK